MDEDMTLLKLQHIMSNEIAKRAFLSRPPEPPAGVLMGDPFQSIFIGTTKIFKVPFTWSFANLTNPHIAVVGITGAGKSYFVKTLLVRANYVWNTNAIIIDLAGEYKAWVKQSGGTVVSLGKGDYMNIMDLSVDEAAGPHQADNELVRDTHGHSAVPRAAQDNRGGDRAGIPERGLPAFRAGRGEQGAAYAQGCDIAAAGKAAGRQLRLPGRAGERDIQAQAVRA